MKIRCFVCERELPVWMFECPYCGESIPHSPGLLVPALALLILPAMIAALSLWFRGSAFGVLFNRMIEAPLYQGFILAGALYVHLSPSDWRGVVVSGERLLRMTLIQTLGTRLLSLALLLSLASSALSGETPGPLFSGGAAVALVSLLLWPVYWRTAEGFPLSLLWISGALVLISGRGGG